MPDTLPPPTLDEFGLADEPVADSTVPTLPPTVAAPSDIPVSPIAGPVAPPPTVPVGPAPVELPGDPDLQARLVQLGMPQTSRTIAAQFTSPRNVMPVSSFEERNVVPGIPLDTQEGVSPWERMMLSTRNAKEDQLRYLRGKYGEDKVRESDTGEWIVRVTDDKTGKERDIVADPHRIDLGDFLSLAGDVPEIAGWIAAEKGAGALPLLGKAKGLIGVARDVVAGAAGAETAGALKDVAVRTADRVPLDLQEIARRRAEGFRTDVMVGGLTVPAQRFFQWSKSPFLGGRDKTQFDAIGAQKYFRDTYGIDVPLSVGQLTGNPDIIRREKFTGKVLGGSQTYQQFERTQQGAMQKVQNILMGKEPADDAVVGDQIIQHLQAKTAPTVEGVETAAKVLGTEAQSQIQQLIEGQTLAGAAQTKTIVGDAIRAKLVSLRDAAKAIATKRYEDFRAITGDAPTISGKGLADAATEIKQDAASVFRPKTTLKFDPASGQMVSVPTAKLGQEVSTAFVPETSIMKRLNEMIANKDGQYRFSDLQKMRTEVYDDMAKSEAVPGMGAHYLSRIGNALTDAMEKGVAAMPDPTAKTALQAANDWYRTKVVPFAKKGIDELFRQPDEAGYVGPAQIASRLMSGPQATDRFNTLKTFLGPASPEFKALKRSIADELLMDAAEPGADTLNARKFLKGFSDFNRQNPEIAQEVFGPQTTKIMEYTRVLARAQEGASFPADETRKLLASGLVTSTKLQSLLQAEAAKDKLFKGQMLKAIADHKTTGLTLTPEDVVNRFINKPGRGIDEITQAMALLSDRPALVEDVRATYLSSLFRQANERGKTFAQALAQAGGDRKARVILGNKLFDDLGQFGMLREGIEFPRGVAESAGAMAGGARIDRLLTHPLSTIPTALREKITAMALTNPVTRKWLTNINPSEPGNLQLILSSAPFIESLTRNFGPGREAQNAAYSIKAGLDDSLKQAAVAPQQGQPSATPSPAMPTLEEFRQVVRAQNRK